MITSPTCIAEYHRINQSSRQCNLHVRGSTTSKARLLLSRSELHNAISYTEWLSRIRIVNPLDIRTDIQFTWHCSSVYSASFIPPLSKADTRANDSSMKTDDDLSREGKAAPWRSLVLGPERLAELLPNPSTSFDTHPVTEPLIDYDSAQSANKPQSTRPSRLRMQTEQL